MPLPRSTNISKLISFIKRERPNMSQKQAIAIAYSQARKVAKDRNHIPRELRRNKRD